jgi:hypothetical protein
MEPTAEQIEYRIRLLRGSATPAGGPEGSDSDSAYFSLIHMGEAVLPFLVRAYRAETDPSRRSLLVEVAWEGRTSKAIDFMAEALKDPNDQVWKQALDGLVTLSGPESLEVLQSALEESRMDPKQARVRIVWIQEAMDQIRGGFFPDLQVDDQSEPSDN